MKKRKGLIAIIVICIVSFIATVALGIACISAFFTGIDNGRIEQAWHTFAERYHLGEYFDLPYDVEDYFYEMFPSVQTPDADNTIDLSVIPAGSDLEIVCGNMPVTVQAGDAFRAQLSAMDEWAELNADLYDFELLRSSENPDGYVLMCQFSLLSHVSGAQLTVSLPADAIGRLDVDCGNGALFLSGVDCISLDAETDNGSLTAENLNVDQSIELSTDNGSLTLSNPLGTASVDCDADNGAIRFSAGELAYYTIDAAADNGRIINNLTTPAQTFRGDGLHYEHHREDGYEGVSLRFQSDNGRIELNP